MESNSNIDEFISIVKDICLLYQSAVYQELIKDLSTDLNSLLTKKLEYILNNNPTSPFFDNFNKSLLKGIERSREASEGMNNESYIETEVNEILSAQERILTEEDHKATIRKLRSKITDCIQKFQDKKRDLIKAVISRDVEKYNNILEEVGLDKKGLDKKITSRESLDRRCDTLDKMVQSLVLHFSYSLLQAEFLEDDKYSKKLNDITKEISQWYKDHEPEEVQFLPPILHRIFTLCQELSYTCQLIRTQIRDTLPPKKGEKNIRKHRVFHAPAYILKSEQYAGGVDAIEMLQANNFYDFAKMLITLTRVDISGVINHSTVSSLLLLYKLCSRLIGEKNNNDAQRRPSRSFFPWNENIEKVFTLIQAKTSLLLVHSFYKPFIDESTGKLDLEKSISTPYSRVENFEILYEGERYILKGEATPDLSLLCDTGFKEFDNLKSVTPLKINDKKLSDDEKSNVKKSNVKKSDIGKYDEYISKGQAIRKDLPNQEELKKELLEGKKFDSKYYPTDILLSLMRTLEEEYTKKEKEKEQEPELDSAKYAEAMGTLLKCFSENIQHYKEFVAADQKRALYKDSFFIIDNYDLSIFISSYGCKLFDTDALEYEVYPQYNRLYRKWLSKAQAEAKELTKEAADKASKASQEATIAAEVVQKASNKAAEAALKASEAKSIIKEESNQILLHVRRESMSIISVFVALITFISVGISILKGVNNLPDYMILAGTLYVFIASIIGFLYFKKIETPQPTGETPQPTGETPQPTGETPQPTGETPQPTGETPQPTGETPQPTEKQFATRCKHFLKKIVSAKGILFSSIGFAVIMIVIGFSWKNDQKLNPKDVEIQEPFFKQIISTDQHVDPIIDQTSNSQKVQQHSLYADSTHKAPRTEASIPKKTSK